MKKIYTLGTGRRSEEDFIEILLSYDIKTLIDVRSFPKSKMPIFTRGNLENLLKKEVINYVFLGRELGGFRKGGYEAYAGTEDFRRGIDKLESVVLRTTGDNENVIERSETPRLSLRGQGPWQSQIEIPPPHLMWGRNDSTEIRQDAVIICAERFPWKCHRRWISRELHRRGWQVEHIIDKGKIWAPK